MWLTGTDEYVWSIYLTNCIALVLNVVIVMALAHRIWATRTVNDRYTLLTRIAKGVLLVSAVYQIVLSTMRLTNTGLPLEFRDTWVLKDIGIFTYVLAITLLHRRLMSGKVGDYDNAKREAQEKSMQEAMDVGRTNHDERIRNEPESEGGSAKPR